MPIATNTVPANRLNDSLSPKNKLLSNTPDTGMKKFKTANLLALYFLSNHTNIKRQKPVSIQP